MKDHRAPARQGPPFRLLISGDDISAHRVGTASRPVVGDVHYYVMVSRHVHRCRIADLEFVIGLGLGGTAGAVF